MGRCADEKNRLKREAPNIANGKTNKNKTNIVKLRARKKYFNLYNS